MLERFFSFLFLYYHENVNMCRYYLVLDNPADEYSFSRHVLNKIRTRAHTNTMWTLTIKVIECFVDQLIDLCHAQRVRPILFLGARQLCCSNDKLRYVPCRCRLCHVAVRQSPKYVDRLICSLFASTSLTYIYTIQSVFLSHVLQISVLSRFLRIHGCLFINTLYLWLEESINIL